MIALGTHDTLEWLPAREAEAVPQSRTHPIDR